jgi:hypothetical protein
VLVRSAGRKKQSIVPARPIIKATRPAQPAASGGRPIAFAAIHMVDMAPAAEKSIVDAAYRKPVGPYAYTMPSRTNATLEITWENTT